MGVCLCCALLCVHSSFAVILMEKRELVALLSLASWCLVVVVRLFLTVPWVCLQFVIVVFPIILTSFTGNIIKQIFDFWGTMEQAIYFRRKKGTHVRASNFNTELQRFHRYSSHLGDNCAQNFHFIGGGISSNIRSEFSFTVTR